MFESGSFDEKYHTLYHLRTRNDVNEHALPSRVSPIMLALLSSQTSKKLTLQLLNLHRRASVLVNIDCQVGE